MGTRVLERAAALLSVARLDRIDFLFEQRSALRRLSARRRKRNGRKRPKAHFREFGRTA